MADARRELIDMAREAAREVALEARAAGGGGAAGMDGAAGAEGAGRLTLAAFTNRYRIGDRRVYREFGSWAELCRAAGLAPERAVSRLSDEAIFAAMHDAFLAAGGVCACHRFETHFRHSVSMLYRRGWSWDGAKTAFRRWAEANAPGFPYMDQLPATPAPAPPAPPAPHTPPAPPKRGPTTTRERGPITTPKRAAPITSAGASFETPASRAPQDEDLAMLFPHPEEACKAVSKGSGGRRESLSGRASGGRRALGVGRALGAALYFRGMLHGPVNEHGVILLFGMVAAELGFMVETVAAGFPDCEAKRLTGPGRWERVRIEFEYLSRNFRDHRHDPAGCDLIVDRKSVV